MSMPQNPLIIRTSPHLKGTQQTDRIMLHVVLSLLPVCAAAVYFFGLSAIALMLTCVVFSVATEYVANRLAQKPPSINDWSAALTGLLLALTLPKCRHRFPSTPAHSGLTKPNGEAPPFAPAQAKTRCES